MSDDIINYEYSLAHQIQFWLDTPQMKSKSCYSFGLCFSFFFVCESYVFAKFLENTRDVVHCVVYTYKKEIIAFERFWCCGGNNWKSFQFVINCLGEFEGSCYFVTVYLAGSEKQKWELLLSALAGIFNLCNVHKTCWY